jgi:hypothetical protein
MKTLRSVAVVVLVLGTLVIPSAAQESGIDSGKIADGLSAQLRGIVYGREGFSGSGGASRTSVGMSLQVWNVINDRTGFDFYASATERPEAVVHGMPAALWSAIASRDGFALYAQDNLAADSSGLSAVKPAAMPAALWQIIAGSDGFEFNTCAVC